MRSLNEYLNEHNDVVDESERIDEFLMTTAITWAIIGCVFAPAIKGMWDSTKGFYQRHMKDHLKNIFSSDARRKRKIEKLRAKQQKREDRQRDKDELERLKAKEKEYKKTGKVVYDDKDEDDSRDAAIAAMSMMKDKDDETKYWKQVISSTIYDEDGDVVPMDERENRLKKVIPEDVDMDDFKKQMLKNINNVEENPELLKKFEKAVSEINESDIDEAEEEAIKTSKEVSEKLKNGESLSDKASDFFKNAMSHIVSDKDEEDKDEDGNVVKQETIKDENGKNVTVTTHTGPRGGKFYWPKGSPHDSDHKVYVSESLRDFLRYNVD